MGLLALVSLLAVAAALQAQTPLTIPNGLPSWAFNIPDKDQPPRVEATGPIRLPGSSKEMDAKAVASNGTPPDWFPDEHPPAPRIVKGEAGVALPACGACHLMSGQGHPESADIAALPVEYFIRQMNYFKTGARKEETRMGPIARAISDEDVRQAAEYFAAIKPIPWVKVIETSTPPKTFVSIAARHRLVVPGGGTEPMGRRIVQIPEDPFRTDQRDPHSPFLAYVPPGSIAKGETLVKTGGSGKTFMLHCPVRTEGFGSAESPACNRYTSPGQIRCKTARGRQGGRAHEEVVASFPRKTSSRSRYGVASSDETEEAAAAKGNVRRSAFRV